jgi:hypothetical protein
MKATAACLSHQPEVKNCGFKKPASFLCTNGVTRLNTALLLPQVAHYQNNGQQID